MRDALHDPTDHIPQSLAQARKRSGLVIRPGSKVNYDKDQNVLSLPLPWLQDPHLRIRDDTSQHLTSDDTITDIYTSSQVIIEVPFGDLFSLQTPSWKLPLLDTLKRFASHPGLTLVLSHHDDVKDQQHADRVTGTILRWAGTQATSGEAVLSRSKVHFLNLTAAASAEAHLRAAMGFASHGQPTESTSKPTPRAGRSAQWDLFQQASSRSGIPALIHKIQTRAKSGPTADDILSLLSTHAAEEVDARLMNAEAELPSVASIATYMKTSASDRSRTLVETILSDVRKHILVDPTAKAPGQGQEPPLLPKWWTVPLIGDAETRDRVQEALQRAWLGGQQTEKRLVWWTGKLDEMRRNEFKRVQQTIEAELHAETNADGVAAGNVTLRLSKLPQSLKLTIRNIFSGYPSGSGPAHLDESVLSKPVAQARDHLFGRSSRLEQSKRPKATGPSGTALLQGQELSAAGYGLAPRQGGTSILDDLQRRVQNIIYRFYGTLGVTFLGSAWSVASSTVTFGNDTLPLILSNPANSTSIALLCLGTTYAFFSLQRSHSRLTSRFLSRDILSRIPSNVEGEVEKRVKHVVETEVYAWRNDLAWILNDWLEGRRENLREDKKSWRRVREGVKKEGVRK